jgi:hypothetical protein
MPSVENNTNTPLSEKENSQKSGTCFETFLELREFSIIRGFQDRIIA